MTNTSHDDSGAQHDSDTDIPAMQKILDNPFLLLFLGVMFPTLLYIVWGVMEIITIPLAR